MSSSAPFSILAAFADNPNAGNPAAVVFVDVNEHTDDIYGKLARNFNQPMTAFVSPKPRPESTEKVLHFDIRFFAASATEIPLCGHASLVAGKAILDSELATDSVEAIEFHTRTRGVATVRKHPGGYLELSAESHLPREADRGQYAFLMGILKKTFGREVAVNYIGLGTGDWNPYVVFELDEKENLKDIQFNASALRETGRIVHVFTARSSEGPELFHTRMFAPGHVPGDEDPVCATAHCILTPYWSKKLDIPRGQEISAKQVSTRGGDLRLVWDKESGKVQLMGRLAELARGQVVISA